MTRGAAGLAKLLALALLSVPLAVAAPASADVPVPTEGSATPSAAESTVSPTATQQDGSQEAAQIVPGTDETSATQHDGSQESAQIVPGTDETSATQQDGSQESGQAVPGTDETSAATGSEPTSESAKPQSAAPGSSTPSAARGRQADADADWVLVKKVVDAPDGVSVPGGTAFGVDYTVDGGSSQTTSVSQDLPVLITGVRVGQEVSVAETGLPAAPDGYRWTTAAYGPREVTPGTGCYAGAGGAGGGGSDERLKQDITPLVTTTNGIQLYTFRYIADPSTVWVGVIAQEIQDEYPDAVSTDEDGYLRVDYSALGLRMLPLDEWNDCWPGQSVTVSGICTGAGGAGGGGSDERLKQDITPFAVTTDGIQLYTFRYIADPSTVWVGVIAQEIQDEYPDAVSTDEDGYLRVDYSALGLRMLSLEEWQTCMPSQTVTITNTLERIPTSSVSATPSVPASPTPASATPSVPASPTPASATPSVPASATRSVSASPTQAHAVTDRRLAATGAESGVVAVVGALLIAAGAAVTRRSARRGR